MSDEQIFIALLIFFLLLAAIPTLGILYSHAQNNKLFLECVEIHEPLNCALAIKGYPIGDYK